MVWTRNQEKELESASVEKKQPLNNHASDNQGELRKYLETKWKHNLLTLMGCGKSSSEEFLQW